MCVTEQRSKFLSSAIFKHDLSVQFERYSACVYRAAHTIEVLGRSLASFQALLWYGRFCLLHTCAFRAGNPNLVQLRNSARYTIFMGLWGNVTRSYPTPRVLTLYALLTIVIVLGMCGKNCQKFLENCTHVAVGQGLTGWSPGTITM